MTCSEIAQCVNNVVVESSTPLGRSIANAAIWAAAGAFGATSPQSAAFTGFIASMTTELGTPLLFPDYPALGITGEIDLSSDSLITNVFEGSGINPDGSAEDITSLDFSLAERVFLFDTLRNTDLNELTEPQRRDLDGMLNNDSLNIVDRANILPSLLLEDFDDRFPEIAPTLRRSLDDVSGNQEAQMLNTMFFANPAVLESLSAFITDLDASNDISNFIALASDPILMSLLATSQQGDNLFFNEVDENRILLEELSGSPVMTSFISSMLSAETVQQVISDTLLDVNEEAMFGDRVSGPLAEAIDHAVTARLEQYGIILPEIRGDTDTATSGSTELMRQEMIARGYSVDEFDNWAYGAFLDSAVSTYDPDGNPVNPIALFSYHPQDTAYKPGYWHTPGESPDTVFDFRDEQVADIVIRVLQEHGLIATSENNKIAGKAINPFDAIQTQIEGIQETSQTQIAGIQDGIYSKINAIQSQIPTVGDILAQIVIPKPVCNCSCKKDELNRPLGGGGGSDTITTTSDQLSGGG